MANKWTNWSGSVEFQPEEIQKPESEEEIRQLVLRAISEKKKIRIAGSGHSSVPLVKTERILIAQDNLKGIVDHDKESRRVKMLPGTNIAETGEELFKVGMSMHNTGDIDRQTLAGAFGTGTHGSGKKLQNLAGMLVGFRIVDGSGVVKSYTLEDHPEMILAGRLSLGALGVFTELTIQTEEAKEFARKEFCTHIEVGLGHLDELINGNQMFDFYWYPRSDLTKLRICNPLGEGMQDIPYAELDKEEEGWLYEILPKERLLKYEEMEYSLPFDAGPECFQEIRQRIKKKHRHYVGWRVLYRTIAADNVYLSPFYKQDSVTIAILQNNKLEYKKYFDDIEPIFRAYGGRPHWGKKHSLKASDLQKLYPEWEKYMKTRKKMDPEGLFVNDYLNKILSL